MAFSIRYMGSKRSLASRICERISNDNPTASILDVFSGMCAVGAELSPKHPVQTNDAHEFAATIAHALFVEQAPVPTSLHAREELAEAYASNAKALRARCADALFAESEALSRIDEPGGWKRLVALNEAYMDRIWPAPRSVADQASNIYSLVTDYFSFGYFSVQQAIEIDSLRYAVDCCHPDRRSYYLSCLLRVASECSAAPGHFAQFLTPKDKRTSDYIARIRKRSVLDRFYKCVDDFQQAECISRASNVAHCSDATELVTTMAGSSHGCSVIYADPPYSKAQYSRYYHVLETIVKYDYPACTGKGRYRDDRFTTGFSQRAKVVEEMTKFVQATVAAKCELYLSYPTNGLLYSAGSSVEEILKSTFPRVEKVASLPLRHSTMGGAPGTASMMVTEDVYRGYF